MWKSRSAAEPTVTLNKHNTSSPLAVGALCGFKKMGNLGPSEPGLADSRAQIPPGCFLSDHTWLCHDSRPGSSFLCSMAHCKVGGQVAGMHALRRTAFCKVGWTVSVQVTAVVTVETGHTFQGSWLLGWGWSDTQFFLCDKLGGDGAVRVL